jgi:L-lactate dehydrogenase
MQAHYWAKGEVMKKSCKPTIVFFFCIASFCVAAPRKIKINNFTRYIRTGHARVAILGAGAVGTATAFCIMMRNMTSEILLADINQEKCRGNVLDMSDALIGCSTSRVKQATFQEAAHADIIVITAGVRRTPGQSRFDLIRSNQKVITDLMDQMSPINPKAVIIVVSNPVDVMTLWVQKLANIPVNQVFGSGTYLDTQRLRGLIAERLGLSEQSIAAYILGEHGESQCPIWSSAYIGGISLKQLGISDYELDELAKTARQKGQEIIALKDATCYGIASCVADMCESILFNQKRVFPVSVYSPDYGICLSLPSVIGENGIEQILPVSLSEQEQFYLNDSAKKLQEVAAAMLSAPVF